MIERTTPLSLIFGCLADDIRRDILARVTRAKLSVSQIAQAYEISLAAVAKHISVLEKAKLVTKERRGKEQLVCVVPETLKTTSDYLAQYEHLWAGRFEIMDSILKEDV